MLNEDLGIFMIISQLIFSEWAVSQINFVEKINTYRFLCSVTFFLKIVLYMRYVEKYGRARQTPR
jgi:hypothetical protein